MMKIKFRYKILIPVVMMLYLVGCSSDWMDVNRNPNSPTTASLNLLLPDAQVTMGFYLNRITNENAAIFVRQYYSLSESQYTHNSSTYATSLDNIFTGALKDFQVIIEQGTSQKRWHYVGVAKVCKAYTYMTLVDILGDIPYDEALNGETNLQPKYEDDAQVYAKIMTLLDGAISDLSKDDLDIDGDVIYGGNPDLWIKAAKSIKFRMYLNTRLVDASASSNGIEALLTDDDLISTSNEDFQFQFGDGDAPLNRHPMYQQEYAGEDNKGFYMDNYFMFNLIEKEDPRLPYYIYRQDDGSGLSFETYPCATRTDCIYGYLGDNPNLPSGAGDGYIGRDHGDPTGLPGDNTIRSTFGVYPIGGSYDDGAFEERTVETGSGGAGIYPMVTTFMMKFMQAEAALMLGTTGDPKTLLEEGIRASMSKVESFSLSVDENAAAMDTSDINDYVDEILAAYDAASDDTQRLNVIIKEKYYACFGNGHEVYTDYRRTGMPLDLPKSLAPAAPFPLRLYYSVNEVNTNPNTPAQPSMTTPIFWDK